MLSFLKNIEEVPVTEYVPDQAPVGVVSIRYLSPSKAPTPHVPDKVAMLVGVLALEMTDPISLIKDALGEVGFTAALFCVVNIVFVKYE